MMVDLVVLLVLGVASYRLTRFLVIDTLLEDFRGKFHTFLLNRTGKLKFLWEKLYELTSCTFCAGVWVSLALYSVYIWHNPTDFSRLDWISVLAVAGVQSLLHAWEPDSV